MTRVTWPKLSAPLRSTSQPGAGDFASGMGFPLLHSQSYVTDPPALLIANTVLDVGLVDTTPVQHQSEAQQRSTSVR